MRSPAIIAELGEHFRKPIVFDTASPISDSERDKLRTVKSNLDDVDPLDKSVKIISIFKVIETDEEVIVRESYEIKTKRF